MSKESKPRDRWSQVYTAASDRPTDFCKGCGYFLHANGFHRDDCTAERLLDSITAKPKEAYL